MKKAEITQFYPWSAEYVVAHALWRKSRGRRPSMSYRGERNPRKALCLAIRMGDEEFEDVVVREVNDDSFVREDGWTFGIQKEWKIVPRPGDIARFYGRGIGSIVRGLDINGVECFYRTEEQQAGENARQRRDFESKERAEFEKNRGSLDEKYQKLPEVFKKRINKFRTNNPDFRWKYEAYEMFCCEQAIIIAAAIGKRLFDDVAAEDLSFDDAKKAIIDKTFSAFKEFYDMPWEKQKELVPDIDDGHSGNTFGFSMALAQFYVSDQLDAIVSLYGALAPLVGSEDYGCVARA